ncbi:MAG: acyl-CoA thioesterase [Marinibacterium sp.]|nr:acyl-CoA thioesterase [Marinibacterium sp.]
MADFVLDVPISFGHCDPAGIVFYPNYYRWFDRCYHTFLHEKAGGHSLVCEKLGAKGTGLIDTGAKFPSPATEGDLLRLEMTLVEWGSRTLRIEYVGYVSDRRVVEGFELRGLFIVGEDGRMRAGAMAPLQDMIGN